MVVANITVSTFTGKVQIAVEVLGKGPYPGTAWVQTLNGLQPFTRQTHGGPCQEDSAVVALLRLCEVRIVEEHPESIEKTISSAVQWFEEPQPVFPEDWFHELEDSINLRRSGGRQM
jgi:hypothetical protein